MVKPIKKLSTSHPSSQPGKGLLAATNVLTSDNSGITGELPLLGSIIGPGAPSTSNPQASTDYNIKQAITSLTIRMDEASNVNRIQISRPNSIAIFM
ncbi:unnamed protein product [Gordionus sp. m RMFG-2023]